MGWPSYLEDILKRREDAGLPPADSNWRRRPAQRRDDMFEAREEYLKRKAAHSRVYNERRKKTAFKRFVIKWLKKLRLIK